MLPSRAQASLLFAFLKPQIPQAVYAFFVFVARYSFLSLVPVHRYQCLPHGGAIFCLSFVVCIPPHDLNDTASPLRDSTKAARQKTFGNELWPCTVMSSRGRLLLECLGVFINFKEKVW